MPSSRPSSPRFTDRVRAAGRWLRPLVASRYLWLGLLGVLGGLLGLYLLMNYVVMPTYTRHGVAVTVPEARELAYERAADVIEEQDLRPERRDKPYNPNLPRDVVVDQNPPPHTTVKPGRRVYLYVNSGPERTVAMPEVRTLSESRALAELNEAGLVQVDVQRDEHPSPHRGSVTRQRPEPGETVGTGDRVTLWISPGNEGQPLVDVPDVRGLAPDEAADELLDAGLWVDPTRSVSGTITRQDPEPGAEVQEGHEVRLYTDPIPEEELDDAPEDDAPPDDDDDGGW